MGTNMYKIQAKIIGVAPLRFNRFIEIDRNSANKKKMTEEQQKKDALNRSYYDEKKGFYVPSDALRACIVNGGKKVKVGRGAASKSLEAIMIFDEDQFLLNTKEHKFQSGVVRIPPKTGARITQYWVVIPKWELSFTANIVDDVFPHNAIKDAIEVAGIYYGLLDGRPQLGRFMLKEFNVITFS